MAGEFLVARRDGIMIVSSLVSQRSPLKTWRIFKEEATADVC